MVDWREDYKKKIFERDGNECVNCKVKKGLLLHHIYPRGKGGSDKIDNLITICDKCHNMVHQQEHITLPFWIKHFKELLKEKNE